ncbi:MAG: exosome complex RNA-binding protein Rrp4 [Candidatus Nanohaloarchaeota archaeon QJJ-5]|nr:exosome complex RNA-binding protein Rrp4 [Candidatus Nanohaloarchaeota archaeon QJJ-5]
MEQLADDRETVVPGQALADTESHRAGDGTFEADGQVQSLYLGTVEYRENNEVRVTPTGGRYIPEKGDSVIGEISRVSHSNWTVELNSPYDAIMPIGEAVEEYVDLTEDDIADWFDIGDLVVAKIQKVTKGKDVQLTMQDRRARKLTGGRVIEIDPPKVPRLIGRKGTMVETIKEHTDTTIIIGQNGRVWIKGDYEGLAADACRKVDREAHTEGLTDTIDEWLAEQRGDY